MREKRFCRGKKLVEMRGVSCESECVTEVAGREGGRLKWGDFGEEL